MRQPIIAVLLGIMLIMSVFPVIAEDTVEDTADADTTVGETAEVAVDANANTGKPAPRDGMKPMPTRKVGAKLEERKENMAERRDNIAERRVALKQNYNETKVRYEDARKKLMAQTNAGVRAAAALNATARLEVTKTFLNAAVDRITAHLERLQDVAEQNNNTQAAADVQVKLDTIAQIKADIDAATTVDQLKALSQKLREEWNGAQSIVAKRYGLIFVEKLTKLIERIENAAEKVDERLEKLEADGVDVTQAQAKVDESLSLIAQAKQKTIEAKAEFELVTGVPGQDEHFKKGHQLLKEANELVRKAHRNLTDFLKDVKKYVKNERKEAKRAADDTRRDNGVDVQDNASAEAII